MSTATASAIIIHFNTDEQTSHLVDRLSSECGPSLAEIIVVDNGSESPLQLPSPRNGITILRMDENAGYAAACNLGAANANAEYLLFLNSDLDVHGDQIAPMIATIEQDSSIGAVGPMLRFEDGGWQLSFGEFPEIRTEMDERKRQQQSRTGKGNAYEDRRREAQSTRTVDWLTGAVLLTKASTFRTLNGFDNRYFFYFEDVDYCKRLHKAGFKCVFTPESTWTHFGGGSQSSMDFQIQRYYRRGQLRYYSRHNRRISFFLLKIYLSTVHIRLYITSPKFRSQQHGMIREILRFPFRTP
ncbi:MAG: hypothetical protein CL946_02685 [Ectothiorhodospiraceae bacterium]|nr:hypothetical protein [Ectothiorhodospiraceae bacterium]